MKHISIILLALLGFNKAGGDTYICKNASVSLYSKAPIEDIEAKTGTGTSVYNSATGDIVFSIPIKSFKFDKSLMQAHFNENYMESDKYPNATFKGKIQINPDVSKDGTYSVTAIGDLDVHGIKQARTIPGTLTIKDGLLSLNTEFAVKCADHKITIPTLVFHNIAERIKIQVTANYSKYQSK